MEIFEKTRNIFLKLLYCADKKFNRNGYSDFDYLGDLSRYTMSELQFKLSRNWKETIVLFPNHRSVKWSKGYISYTLLFSLTGEFIQIKEEKKFHQHTIYDYCIPFRSHKN